MDEMDTTMWWQPKISVDEMCNFWEVHLAFWALADELLEAEEISDKLFKKIGKALAKKIWFWRDIGVKNECA